MFQCSILRDAVPVRKATIQFMLIAILVCGVRAATQTQTDDQKQWPREPIYYKYMGVPALIKGGSIKPHWMSDGNSFWYAEGAPAETVIHVFDPKSNTRSTLFDTERVRKALAQALGHEPPYKGLPFDEFTFVDDGKAVKFSCERKEFLLRFGTYQVTAVPQQSEAEAGRLIPRVVRKGFAAGSPDVIEVLSTDKKWFALERDNNLWLRSTYDGRTEQLTTDGVKDYDWNVEGAKWSPDGQKLVVQKQDNRKVPYIPLVHWLKPVEEVEWHHYSKAGGPLTQTELYIIHIFSKQQVRIDTGDEPDQHLSMIGWLPDGSEFLFVRANREFKKLELMAANPTSGATRVIVTETQKTFVVGIPFSGPLGFNLFNDGKKFVWISERDGWKHLYLYNIDGTLIRQLTRGSFPVGRMVTIDEKKGWVYFTAHAGKRLYDTHLYRVNLEGEGFARLTEAPGQHDNPFLLATPLEGTEFSPSKEFFLDTHSSVDRPQTVELRQADGKLVQVISKANIDKLIELKWPAPEEFIVKAADGKTDLYGVIFKPADFDPNRKYPVVDSIYNGPFTTWVPRTFTDGRGVEAQAMAQLGFIVIMVDGRGTTERGKQFQDVVYGNFGRNEIPDHAAALKEVASSRPYMDLSRVGMYGGSWGGYMTIRALVLAPDIYHVGVATVPVSDLIDHSASAIEPYMGTPEHNREGYEYASSQRLAGNLKGKLLMIPGTSDVNAPFSATMKMVEALIRAGKPYDLIVLPDQNHWATGASQRYIAQAKIRYFEEHLRPERLAP